MVKCGTSSRIVMVSGRSLPVFWRYGLLVPSGYHQDRGSVSSQDVIKFPLRTKQIGVAVKVCTCIWEVSSWLSVSSN